MQRIGATVFGLFRGMLSPGGSNLMETSRALSTLSAAAPAASSGHMEGLLRPFNPILTTAVRTLMRNHFPRPKETKRIRCHGWKTRMQTANGRRIIMRRILKGRYVLTH